MKKVFFSTILVASFGVSTAYAGEISPSSPINSALSGISASAAVNLQDCLESDRDIAATKAVHACTKAFRASIPNYGIRSDILTRRGWLQLSAGKYDRAARDFKSAAKLNNVNEFAYLGDGFVAMMKKDYAGAMSYFNDCKTHNEAAPLAYYGLGMTKELAGDKTGAFEAYQQASKLLPEWEAPREELLRFKTSI